MIPSEAIACFDIRVTPHFELEKMNQILNSWCDEVGASWENILTDETNDHYVTETLNNPFFEKLIEVFFHIIFF